MTQDKARKRDVRRRAAQTGESYTRAARLEAGGTTPPSAADAPALEVPPPVALMFARHIRAAELHLGAASHLAEQHGAAIGTPRLGDPSPGPLYDSYKNASDGLLDLYLWGEKTATASGVVPVAPGLDPRSEQETAAEHTLYPASNRWCHRPGGTLPQPGEQPGADRDELPRVRYSLPGPIPSTRLVAHAQGRTVVKARDVVPGTPAAAVWEAHSSLYGYVCQWPERGGDSPADLAAAADGLTELASTLASAAADILDQIEKRTAAGSLAGIDPQRVTTARTRLAGVLFEHNPLRGAMSSLRATLDGATAALPPTDGQARLPGTLARKMAGKTTAELRAELGAEVHWQRHRSKTRVPVYDKADALQRMIQWCHATGRDSYDPAAHASDDPGAW